MIVFAVQAQEVSLPVDLRQHNLTNSNSSIFNPAFAVNYGNSQSIGLWTRWQWQMVDADPTTFLLNYTGKLNSTSSVGAGFYQHNTGIFLNTGGVLNYAYEHVFSPRTRLAFGLNLFGYMHQLSDNRFQIDPQILLPQLAINDDFILQLAPGVQFYYDRFSIGLASENLFDYNVTDKERFSQSNEKIFLVTTAYDFPVSVMSSDSTSVIRPIAYVKSIPGFDTQVGFSALLSTDKFWGQLGYNSFYGISLGGGGRFMKRFSLGALVEFGTDSALKGSDPSFELVTSYDFGTVVSKKKISVKEEEKEEEKIEEIAQEDKIKEELTKAEALALEKNEKEQAKELRKKTKDSLALAKKESAMAAANLQKAEQRKIDSINRAKKAETAVASRKISRQKQLDSLAVVEKEKAIADATKRSEQIKIDSINKAKEAIALAEIQRREQQRETDSLNEVKRIAADALAQKEKREQVVQATKEDRPKAGEKYEEVVGEDGLVQGYYLIANVFGTKKYYDAFMADLSKKGLQPKSFYRSKNKFNYVYLERYGTMGEARKARDSKFSGRYADKTWIYRVK